MVMMKKRNTIKKALGKGVIKKLKVPIKDSG